MMNRSVRYVLSILSLIGLSCGFSASNPIQQTRRKGQSAQLGATVSTARPAETVDEANAFARSTFRIPPTDLVERAKKILGPDIGFGTKDGGECLADDFEFCAAVVGPLPKDEYLNALGSFKLEESFDITMNLFGFHVDPLQPNRVWFFQRQTAQAD
eukprot:scaffold1442_cov128-Cylindrotheca_fusiformis.AAC.21